MEAHSRILAWKISRTEEPGGYGSLGRKESDTTEATDQSRSRKTEGTLAAILE